jgi:predicted CXXCH cytochrome family protein
MKTREVAGRLLSGVLCGLSLSFLCFFPAYAEEPKTGHKDCTTCHGKDEEKTAIKKKINETCLACHPGNKGRDHEVGIVSKMPDNKLPLGEGDIITCATCHEPHGKTKEKALLRMNFNDLCKSCHKK